MHNQPNHQRRPQQPARSPREQAPLVRATDDAPEAGTLDDSELYKQVYSPVCTYCNEWRPADGMHCAAWPPSGKPLIPQSIWSGQNMHITPVGGEKLRAGKPIVFTPHPDVKRTSENAALLDAYARAHRSETGPES